MSSNCPIPNAHRRLEEAHRLWHRAGEAYEDPEEFRTQLNALIQALRSVTFLLQKEQQAVPDFVAWYEPWQAIMGDDAVLRWLVRARNVIVHEGDLATHSTATAWIQSSWDEPQTATFEVPPLVPTLAVAAKILAEQDIPADVRKQGILSVERRWVADGLPDLELLDALAHSHGILSLLIQDAHRQAGAEMDIVDDTGHEEMVVAQVSDRRLPCMVANEEMRTVRVHLGTSELIEPGFKPVPLGPPEDVLERYGGFELPPPKGSVDPLEWAPTYMTHAKRVLQVDKYHSQMAFLFGPRGPIGAFSTMPGDQQGKFTFMNSVAVEVRRSGATGLVVIADTWWVPGDVDIPPGKRPADMAERQEALQVTAARSDGSARTLVTPYRRAENELIEFGETGESAVKGGNVFLLPVMQAWGLSGDTEQEALEGLRRRDTAE